MQKLFIIKESGESGDNCRTLPEVHEFIGNTGRIIMMQPFGIAATAAGGQSSQHGGRQAGRIMVVADDGKGQNVQL